MYDNDIRAQSYRCAAEAILRDRVRRGSDFAVPARHVDSLLLRPHRHQSENVINTETVTADKTI